MHRKHDSKPICWDVACGLWVLTGARVSNIMYSTKVTSSSFSSSSSVHFSVSVLIFEGRPLQWLSFRQLNFC